MSSPVHIVYTSRAKCALMSLVVAAFLGICLTALVFQPHAVTFSVAALAVAFCAPSLAFFVYHALVRRPAVTIFDEGVIDSAWPLAAGLVRWHELSDISIVRYGLARWLALVPHEPAAIWSRMAAIKRLASQSMSVFGILPFIIPEYTIEGSLDDLFDKIKSYYEGHIKRNA
jgi:hypothetical protein